MTTTKNVSTLTAANVATLSGAFTRHTHALSTNQSIGDVVRKGFSSSAVLHRLSCYLLSMSCLVAVRV